jgi:hypothetical protein
MRSAEAMLNSLHSAIGDHHTLRRSLLGYFEPVCDAVGVGLESCVLDLDHPVSAYIALDCRLDRYPDRDLALVWDERHGWALAMETHSGEDLIVVRYLAGRTATPRCCGMPQVVGSPAML